ncbi:MAG: large conductance mechanosensitive channel protein MscL [Actinomycetota bacterium]
MLKEFKSFILRGNAVDLAVGVVIGAAFGAVVNSIVSNILTPLTTIACTPDRDTKQCAGFENLSFSLGNSTFAYGKVLNAVISLLVIGAAVFFLVVRPLNALEERRKRQEPEPESPTRPCPECLSEIPKQARRCAHCTAEVGAAA